MVSESSSAREPEKTSEANQIPEKAISVSHKLEEFDIILDYAWKLLSLPFLWARDALSDYTNLGGWGRNFLPRDVPEGLFTGFMTVIRRLS